MLSVLLLRNLCKLLEVPALCMLGERPPWSQAVHRPLPSKARKRCPPWAMLSGHRLHSLAWVQEDPARDSDSKKVQRGYVKSVTSAARRRTPKGVRDVCPGPCAADACVCW